ncbi:hypothetical protein A2715_05500 [Candidatus Woesebacteria bacterium RIFCSPHIGHO2_01_FULL_39_32]|uniref:SEA domain-containing protein n=1 Tax=Candidatus Woesebacteria bacterium RIFCSPLOWO2_01_FULL_39_25 TaxID=1802521 RepID=A0A1F8BLR8_9BACT|nr:MAG: hypothetical protein A2124_03945 [Candidatus Woesebacteria bacterium GWB1_37_5]OGM25475.1 MAG: hypothetical protein A2715_05500 [Candidatus Woesebacteria bacterium RIFCSPHIGHO2_01_FULL_39_32]OGM38578.1 MAG: hypothetical protein A3F01_04455 [Candidatus Woesebacteria bacterium RIFCSPHIGHO2_12_FULL_38_11]OGM65006.1 MAG: hypothetical protein A2893_05110 [Candidatus Woesebacteria bacterium RIFCSPLOWO2_01_FULL_39_25]
MAPEIYFGESDKKPNIRVKLLPGEASDDLNAVMPPINDARNMLDQRYPDYDVVQHLLTDVIGEVGARELIEAYKKRQEFSIKFQIVNKSSLFFTFSYLKPTSHYSQLTLK